METGILTELGALSAITVALAALLGFLGNGSWRNGRIGAFLLGLAASFASGACLLGFQWGGWRGLLVGVLLVALAGGWLGSKLGKRRGGLFVAFLWLGYCATCAVGYRAAGWLGWLTVTLPSVALFWYGLWRFSGRLLPLEDNRQRRRAFRSLLTFTAGTNYPYYVVENGKPEERVGGNPFGMLFAGPGIVITEPHQAAVITDGMEIKKIATPGLTFTSLFERVGQIVDLRPQLKAFDVDAITKDGIRIRVLTFVFFKIRSPNLPPGRFWADGESEDAIFSAVRAQPVEEAERRDWDDLVPMVAERSLQDIISRYRCNKLCAGNQPDWLPHEEIPFEVIKRELRDQLRHAMALRCEGIQILGAGIANLAPVEGSVMQQRIENWRTEWTRKMMAQMGEGATEAMRRVSQARAQGQAEVIRILSREAEHMDAVDRDILADVLVLRLLEALESMARRPSVQQLLPPEATETMKYLRRAIGEGNSTKAQEPGR